MFLPISMPTTAVRGTAGFYTNFKIGITDIGNKRRIRSVDGTSAINTSLGALGLLEGGVATVEPISSPPPVPAGL